MESRKSDHIELAFTSQVSGDMADKRFDYEPLSAEILRAWGSFPFLGKTLEVPMWVSSMTGGTAMARRINTNLAMACKEFGMGMGLGSCRILLINDKYLADFDMRSIIGDDLPFYANIGIAQLEQMISRGELQQLVDLVGKLRADGLIVHVNPLQEYLQDEGDTLERPVYDTLAALLDMTRLKVIVKEVGQGMGPESIYKLMHLPLEAYEFAAFGGTNFSKLELYRSDLQRRTLYESLSLVGHSAGEMLKVVNGLVDRGETLGCKHLIISGGIRTFLDGFYLVSNSRLPAVYGQASGFLRHAQGEYQELKYYVEQQLRGLLFARAYLRPKPLI